MAIQWATVMNQEWWQEGDLCKMQGVPIGPMSHRPTEDRLQQHIAGTQIGFSDFVIAPFLKTLQGGLGPLMGESLKILVSDESLSFSRGSVHGLQLGPRLGQCRVHLTGSLCVCRPPIGRDTSRLKRLVSTRAPSLNPRLFRRSRRRRSPNSLLDIFGRSSLNAAGHGHATARGRSDMYGHKCPCLCWWLRAKFADGYTHVRTEQAMMMCNN
jgi:hypothetical protein